jgi:hypothetical protein
MSPPGCRRSSARRAIASASGFRLYGRTRHRSVGTEHAAVARLRLQLCATAGANIEKLTGIGWHDLRLRKCAVWTGDDRLKRHGDRLSAADSMPPWQLAVSVDSHRPWRRHKRGSPDDPGICRVAESLDLVPVLVGRQMPVYSRPRRLFVCRTVGSNRRTLPAHTLCIRVPPPAPWRPEI